MHLQKDVRVLFNLAENQQEKGMTGDQGQVMVP
jgi:hypothetical protein